MSDAANVAAIGVIPKIIWPVVALIVVGVFHGPLGDAIRDASDRGGASVQIGAIKITIPKRDVPAPPRSIKDILPGLTPPLIEYIISNVGGDNTIDLCYQQLTEFQEGSVSATLQKLKLITIEKEPMTEEGTGKPCLTGGKTRFLPLYNEIRNYLIDVLKALQFSH